MSDAEHPLRLSVATAVSAAVHAALLALVMHQAAPTGDFVMALTDPGAKAELIPVRLVARPGGGGGGPLPGLPSPPTGPPDLPAVAHEPPAPIRRVAAAPPPMAPVGAPTPAPVAAVPDGRATAALRALAMPRPAPAPVRAARPAAPITAGDQTADRDAQAGGAGAVANLGAARGSGGRGGGGGAGTGDGSGGDGSDALARPAYGTNPKPPYPLAARRLGVEGVVTLEVLVRADGSPAEVRIRSSSGSALLDDSAVDTVRSKWRFTPARRGDAAIESLVTFPIRFSLDAS